MSEMATGINFTGPQLVGLKVLDKIFPKAVATALDTGANTMLDWMNEGSPRESRTPPVKYGNLIESSSVFVGSRLAGVGGNARGALNTPGKLQPDPLKTYKGKAQVITVIYNSSYAAKMHEWRGGWGPNTLARNDAGNKWVEKHLIADKEAVMKLIGKTLKKEIGL